MVSSGIITILLITGTIDPNEFSFKVRLTAVSPKMCSFLGKITITAVTDSQQFVHYSLSDLSLGDIISTVCLYAVQLEVRLVKTHKFKWKPCDVKGKNICIFFWVDFSFRLNCAVSKVKNPCS